MESYMSLALTNVSVVQIELRKRQHRDIPSRWFQRKRNGVPINPGEESLEILGPTTNTSLSSLTQNLLNEGFVYSFGFARKSEDRNKVPYYRLVFFLVRSNYRRLPHDKDSNDELFFQLMTKDESWNVSAKAHPMIDIPSKYCLTITALHEKPPKTRGSLVVGAPLQVIG